MKSALDYFHASFAQLRLASRAVSAGLWEKNYGLSWGRMSSLTQIVMFILLHAFTGFRYRNNIQLLLQSQSLICTGAALSIKYFTMIRRRDAVRKLTSNIETTLYMRYEETSLEYPVVLKYSRMLYIGGHVMTWGYCCSLAIIAINPAIVYITEGRMVLLFFVEIPHVDWSNNRGYLITMAVQITMYLTGTFGLILVDYLCAFFTSNGALYVDIFRFHLEQLGNLLQDLGYQMATTQNLRDEVNRKWRDCLAEHQHIVEFFEEFSNLWSMINLAQVCCSVFGICINMLLLLLDSRWYAAYAILFALFVDLSVHFLFGAFIEKKIDDLHDSLVQFSWYLFDDQHQKEYKLLLLRSQMPCGMSIAGLTPVNYETYTQVK
uniref:Odorant receptor n=1 Tax=Anopheles farauti TaxID=69004 RepID=A0A182R0K5_9DIPT